VKNARVLTHSGPIDVKTAKIVSYVPGGRFGAMRNGTGRGSERGTDIVYLARKRKTVGNDFDISLSERRRIFSRTPEKARDSLFTLLADTSYSREI